MSKLPTFAVTLLIACAQSSMPQTGGAIFQTEGATIHEPGTYRIADLFNRADKVVLAKVVAGDTESYDVAIYKARVIEGFKGASTGETIFFGPYVGVQLGSEYFLFLRDVPTPKMPKTVGGFGTVKCAEVFDEGYTSMRTSYECVFSGKDVSDKCNYGVRVCTDYIKLPKSLPAFPPESADPPFGCRWVEKNRFASLLDDLVRTNR